MIDREVLSDLIPFLIEFEKCINIADKQNYNGGALFISLYRRLLRFGIQQLDCGKGYQKEFRYKIFLYMILIESLVKVSYPL